MAMAVFVIAAVSLAEAISTISVSAVEAVESSDLRVQMRGLLLEAGRDPLIEEGRRETLAGDAGVFFRTEISRWEMENRESLLLDNLYEIKVTALRRLPGQGEEELDSATTAVYAGIQ